MTTPSAHESFSHGLLRAHDALRAGLAAVLASEGAEGVVPFCVELSNHHHAEDAFIFPALRTAGRLHAADVAFLDARDAEHVEVHRLCEALHALGRGPSSASTRAEIVRLAGELQFLAVPHFAAEERVLTPVHLATLITARELAAMHRDMGLRWNDPPGRR